MTLPWRSALTLLGLGLAVMFTRPHPSAAAPATLTILHTNDIHGYLTAWRGWEGELAGKTIGGLDRLAAAIKQVRATIVPENLLLLDAGDTFGDTLIAEATKGQAILTAADLGKLIPHPSKVVSVTLTGTEVREILEQAVNNVLTDDPLQKVGGMIQVSGLRFRYDPHAPLFQRVREVSVSGAPLALDRHYRVATNSLLVEGGHRYRTFRDGRDRHEHEAQYDIVKAWITRHGVVSAPPADRIVQSPAQEGRGAVQYY